MTGSRISPRYLTGKVVQTNTPERRIAERVHQQLCPSPVFSEISDLFGLRLRVAQQAPPRMRTSSRDVTSTRDRASAERSYRLSPWRGGQMVDCCSSPQIKFAATDRIAGLRPSGTESTTNRYPDARRDSDSPGPDDCVTVGAAQAGAAAAAK